MGPKQYSQEKDDVRIMLKTLYREVPHNFLSETERCQKHVRGKKKNSNVQCMNNMIAFKICIDNFSSFSKGKYEVTVVNVTF